MDLNKALNLDKFTEEEKNQILAQLTDSLLKRLTLRIYDRLNIADQAVFDKLGLNGDESKISDFLSEKVPDFDQIRNEELEGLVEEMQSFISKAK